MSSRPFIDRAALHLASLSRTALRLTRSRADADDLVQDTLMRAYEKRDDLADPDRMRGWLLAIQRTVWLNDRRPARRRLEVLQGDRDELPSPAGNLAEEVLAGGLPDELEAALSALPPEWRDALWLREVEELSYLEIAQMRGCPIGTVRSRIARARAAVLEQMTKEREHAGL